MLLLTRFAVTVLLLSSAHQGSCSEGTEEHSIHPTEYDRCLHANYCSDAAICCQFGVDEYGWIAAAVGWSLWFLTLILLCVSKLMQLRPDEPKYLGA